MKQTFSICQNCLRISLQCHRTAFDPLDAELRKLRMRGGVVREERSLIGGVLLSIGPVHRKIALGSYMIRDAQT